MGTLLCGHMPTPVAALAKVKGCWKHPCGRHPKLCKCQANSMCLVGPVSAIPATVSLFVMGSQDVASVGWRIAAVSMDIFKRTPPVPPRSPFLYLDNQVYAVCTATNPVFESVAPPSPTHPLPGPIPQTTPNSSPPPSFPLGPDPALDPQTKHCGCAGLVFLIAAAAIDPAVWAVSFALATSWRQLLMAYWLVLLATALPLIHWVAAANAMPTILIR